MADLFEAYEEDFTEVRNNIERRIHSIPSLEGGYRQNAIQQAEAEIAEAEQIVRTMGLSARNVSSNHNLLKKIKEYENETSKLKTDLRKSTMQFKGVSDREELFGGLKEDHLASSMDSRERLLTQTERLERSKAELDATMAEADSSVRLGMEIMENLDDQRNTMRRIQDRLSNINVQIKSAKKVMARIARRAIANKVIMAVVILVLLGAIVLIVYLAWFSGSGGSESPPPRDETPEPTQ